MRRNGRYPRNGVLLMARGLFRLSKTIRRQAVVGFLNGRLGSRPTSRALSLAEALGQLAARLAIHELTRDRPRWVTDHRRGSGGGHGIGRPIATQLLLASSLLAAPVVTAHLVRSSPWAHLAVLLASASFLGGLSALVRGQLPTDAKPTRWDASVVLCCGAIVLGHLEA